MNSFWKCVAVLATGAIGMAYGQGRLADVRIVDRAQGRTLPVYWHDGEAYVAGKPGNEYEIVVRNRAGDDLLAVVSVDGVNVVSGRSAAYRQRGYIVPRQDRVRIEGWRKSLDETAAFYFTELDDSYAARTDRPDDVGVIGVALFERARRGEAPSRPGAKSYRAPGDPLGTGHGRLEDSPASQAEFERATTDPAEVIRIRYDSYANLVAQGVIPRYGRRRPDPFPNAFVPDPPRYRGG